MGEIAVSGDGGGGRLTEETEANVMRWDKFLPKMVLRVLLIEADDSTRQLITALLRKCNYKVAAVSDGLKAWEVLKARPHNIDLILTEVELPSVSGFALLTLIAEHETCKNIPVIMMSAHDSVSTVYKCMLKGAADFLVKPIRKNELKNLWQHVWRRRASISGGDGPQEESDGQQEVEATAENNATSNHSSGYMACIQRNRECIEKGSDAQSSCTKPYTKVEEAPTETQKNEDYVKGTQQLLTREDEGEGKNVNTPAQRKDLARDNSWDRDIAMTSICDNGRVITNTSREVIDLIGAFDSYPKCSQRSSLNSGKNRADSSPFLDLSLRRSPPSGSINQVNDERPRLKHSDASAFSRYINRTLSATICNHQKEQESRIFSAPVPLRDLRFENIHTGYGSALPSIFNTQSGPSPRQTPGSSEHQEPSFQQLQNLMDSKVNNAIDQTEHRQVKKMESFEDPRHISSANDQCGSSSFCNPTLSRLNSLGSGSNGNANSVRPAAGDSANDSGLIRDGASQRSILREAALNKFRLKRKDRCFEKKVRYASRKKLAEQRPRVKGQFVRQVITSESLPMETED